MSHWLMDIRYDNLYCKWNFSENYNISDISMVEHKSQQQSSSNSVDISSKKQPITESSLPSAHTHTKQQQISQNKKKIRRFLQNIYFQIVITLVSLYSLYSDDIRTATTDASADLAFDTMHIIFMATFAGEIILNFISFDEYRWSFFFVLDIISCLSILLDVSMVTAYMFASMTSFYNLGRLAAQSRASRVAARAVRLVKLVRIIRIIKLYKAAMKAKQLKQQRKKKRLSMSRRRNNLKTQIHPYTDNRTQNRTENRTQNKIDKKDQIRETTEIHQRQVTAGDFLAHDQNLSPRLSKSHEKSEKHIVSDTEDFLFDADFMEQMSEQQSKISKVLSDLTLKKVIIAILLMMFLIPLFMIDNYREKCESWDQLTTKIRLMLLANETIPLDTINDMIWYMIYDHQGQDYIIYFSTPFNEMPLYAHERYGKQRVQDITISVENLNLTAIQQARPGLTIRSDLSTAESTKIYTVMNYHGYNTKCAWFSIGRTTFICIVLIGLLSYFSEDINELIVNPIEKMMKQVMQMAKNPQSVTMSLIDNTQYQTAIVHNAIIKIGALLSLIFGSAGAEIIGENIMLEGDMNPLIGGKKKCAIFGFCDIRNFTQVTEVLHEDIMLFVNKIGELVHSAVYRYGGSANKNIGQAFLMVWPLPKDSYKINHKTNEITWKRSKYVNVMTNFSIYSFIKAIVKIHKDPSVLQYKNDKRLIESYELGPNYQVKMGFGLHIGWAIEGPIGSQYKIDASYLSPNVNMASRLEAATKQFGVNILLSESLYEMATTSMKKFCRNIDRVTVKGSQKPLKIYTIDLRLDNISPPMDKTLKYKNPEDMLDVQVKREINMEYLQDDRIDQYDAEAFILGKKQLREVMIEATSQEFRKRFELGLESYLDGKWSDAKLHLGQALKYSKNDGPTKNILNYMKKFDFVAPETWKHYRPLTEK